MATFVIESYLSRARAHELDEIAARLRAAKASMPRVEPAIRHRRSYFVPDDELCFHVIEAPSKEAAIELVRLAGVIPDRIVEAEATAG